MTAESTVEDTRQIAKPALGIRHGSFRRVKAFVWFYTIAEVVRMDPKQETGLVILIKLGASYKISAVKERETIAASGILCRIPIGQDQERIVLVT